MSIIEKWLSKENLELVAEVILLRENNAAMDMLLYEALIGAEEVNKELTELRGQNRRLKKELDLERENHKFVGDDQGGHVLVNGKHKWYPESLFSALKLRAEKAETERDEARRLVCKYMLSGSKGSVTSEKHAAMLQGWMYLYPESEGE